MITWVFDFALINDFPTRNWGHFPLVLVFQVEIWETCVFFCKESQTMSTWVFDFGLINDFPTPNWGHFPLLWSFLMDIREGIPNLMGFTPKIHDGSIC